MLKLAQVPEEHSAAEPQGASVSRIHGAEHRYYAFLSYSHKDEEVASWLHRELEGFRVPRSLQGKLTAMGVIPPRLTPIFRDRHELAAADDLGAEIRHALASSQYLIVLCSPAAAHSRWTNAEIEAFKKSRPEGCVLAAIVDGEPFASDVPGHDDLECFPPALQHKYDRRGRPTAKRSEPLAADLRESGDGRRLGFLKIVAGMLGVALDDLVQRENIRRHRRLAWLAAASLTGMAVTSTLAITAIQARDAAREQRREAEGLVGFMLGDLRDKLDPIGRLDALDAVGSRALAYYQKQDKSELSDDALAQRANALRLMGEIANTRGDLSGALKRYQEALASTAETVRRHPDDPQKLWEHAQNVYWVGYIAYQRGQMNEAAARFGEYKRLANQMVALAPDKKDYRLEQVYANNSLGAVLADERRYPAAAATFESSLGAAESLAASDPRNVDYQKRVVNDLGWLADAHESTGELEEALGERERQLRVLNDLKRIDPRDTDVDRDSMTAHRSIGRLLASRGDSAAGLKELLAAAAIYDTLFKVEPDNTEWLQASARTLWDLADLQLSEGQIETAAATTRQECDIVDRLLERDTSVADWRSRLRVGCLEQRARVALVQGNSAEALNLARQSLAAARSSPKPIDRGILSMRSMAVGSNALEQLGRHDESLAWATDALRSVPGGASLMPREAVDVAMLKLRVGDRDGARQLSQRLAEIGYRHPAYTRSGISQRAT